MIKSIITLSSGLSFLSIEDQYDRNHGPIPHISADEHIVHVDGNVVSKLELSIDQLSKDFEQHEIVCVLQCAGNRRHVMRTLLKEVDGIDWGEGAVMNCKWKGPKLKDVLQAAGLSVKDMDGQHAAFSCLQTPVQGSDWYGGSIELWRAMKADADVLLALEVSNSTIILNTDLD